MTRTRSVTRVEFSGPAGRLAGLLHRPDAPPSFAAVVSHPHPLFGGTMDNKVVYRVARALEDAGGLVLRYDFRGAGGSEGTHDRGVGERDDLRAALAFLRSVGGKGLPTLLAGFSFGSAMTSLVGVQDATIPGMLLVGAPIRSHPFEELRGSTKPVALIQGDRDEHGPIDAIAALAASLRGPARLVVIPGANHFFDDAQDDLTRAVGGIMSTGHFGTAFTRRTAGE